MTRLSMREDFDKLWQHNNEVAVKPLDVIHNGVELYEGQSAYYLLDLNTGREACLGDGVDMVHTGNGKALSPGTMTFNRVLTADFKANVEEWRKVYFDEPEAEDNFRAEMED